jgi:hypothetical protein
MIDEAKINALIADFIEAGVLEDRCEYSVDDLLDAGYGLTREEAEALHRRLQTDP